jgi:hypothetical protein
MARRISSPARVPERMRVVRRAQGRGDERRVRHGGQQDPSGTAARGPPRGTLSGSLASGTARAWPGPGAGRRGTPPSRAPSPPRGAQRMVAETSAEGTDSFARRAWSTAVTT